MRRLLLPTAALLACLALVLGGCGGSDGGSSTSSSTSAGGSAKGTTSTGAGANSTTTTESGATTPSESGSGSSGGSGSSPGSGSSGDNSIQTYGSAAGAAQKSQIAGAAFSFFKAMAGRDYTALCKGLAASNRAQLEVFLKASHHAGGCPAALKALVSREIPAARKAAAGTLTAVRVQGTTAFVLFRPKGGAPSYFVMKREGGAWKAISLAPGTPLRITTPPGG